MAASLPANEAQRLDALLRLGILDTPRKERFDRVSRLAALAFNCPFACISLVDRERVWFWSENRYASALMWMSARKRSAN